MAGELEHIRPTHPSGGNLASRTRNINFTDANGVLHSVTHVYWSPTNDPNDRKLIWQRDHTPVSVKYTNLGTDLKLFKWICPSNVTSISSAAIWVTQSSESGWQYCFSLTELRANETQLWTIGYINNNSGTWNNATDQALNVDGTSIVPRKITVTTNNPLSVTPGKTYYIMITDTLSQNIRSGNIGYINEKSDYIEYNDQPYKLGQLSDDYNYASNITVAKNVYKIKAEINGVQI